MKARKGTRWRAESGSDQQEVDQRYQGRADAGGDQGVVGPKVVLHVE